MVGVITFILGEGAMVQVAVIPNESKTTHPPQRVSGKLEGPIREDIWFLWGGLVGRDGFEEIERVYASP